MRTNIGLGIAIALAVAAVAADGAPIGYETAVLADNPLLYYRLNESSGNTANLGSLGGTHDGVVNGAPTRGVASAAGDTAIQFGAAADFIESLGVAPTSLTGNPSTSVELGDGATWRR